MKAKVDESLCIGCELCVQLCPGVFTMVGEFAKAADGPLPPDQEKCAKQAAAECPVEAIAVS